VNSSMTNSNTKQSRRRGLGAVLLTVAALAGLALTAIPASAAYTHPYETKFPVGGECFRILDIAVLEPEGQIFVACSVGTYPNERDQIKRFDLNGNPLPFSGVAPYISGNTLTGDPSSEDGTLLNIPDIAVDNSPGVNHGKLFVASSPDVDIFLQSGIQQGQIEQPVESTIGNYLAGIDVDQNGFIYVTSGSPGQRVSKYNSAFQELKRMYTGSSSVLFGINEVIRVDTTGAVWVKFNNEIRKYEVDQFTDELKPRLGTPAEAYERFFAKTSPFAPNPVVSGDTVGDMDVDLSDNDLYVHRGTYIQTYSAGKPGELSHPNSPPIGTGDLSGDSMGSTLAVTKDHHIYATTNGTEIARFGAGEILPEPHTFAADIDEVGHEEATVRGEVQLAGGTPIKACKFEYGTSTSYGSSKDCEPNPAAAPPGSYFGDDTEVSAELTGLTTGTTYHYRVMAENEKGKNEYSIDRTVTPAYVLKLKTLPASDIDTDGAKLNASFDPDGEPTEFKFQYGVTSDYGLETSFQPGGSGTGIATVGITLDNLPSGQVFHYRVIAKNAAGETIGDDQTFRVASTPDVSGVRASEITADSAVLSAAINPGGFDTEYVFEYGTTSSYGETAPVSFTGIGAGSDPVDVNQKVEGLLPGVTYHFRVVAINKWGTTESPDTTFDFTPPTCPNNHVRQQTTSAYLPDCRAYELVSPGAAGAAVLMPSHFATEREENTQYAERVNAPVNRGFASSPSRFAYYSAISTVEGSNSPVGTIDMYMATRTNQGWITRVPGLQGNEAFETARKECSDALDLCTDHSETQFFGYEQEAAPYLFNSQGKYLGRLPTNVEVIPGGKKFKGGQRVSDDFSHFAFASSEFKGFSQSENSPGAVFAPGGLTEGIGSAYDNDIRARTVEIISRYQDGDDILVDPAAGKTPADKGFDFPGMSPDGSHILMQTPANKDSSLVHLFMRVDNLVTYDITKDADVQFVGMTRDGGQVLFVTGEALIAADKDTSTDLYMWEEDGSSEGAYRVVSQNSQSGELVSPGKYKAGNSDECSAGWGVSGCGIKQLTTENDFPSGKVVSMRGLDDLIAEGSGDVYFYSPENLDPDDPAILNQRNLYVYRDGEVQLVTTFLGGTEVQRMQISADGDHAAMLTKARLTSYDNQNTAQVYTYDADSGEIHCASCKPSGLPPTASATVSQGGRFMTEDGRTFFSTPDPLVPRDQNALITDTYEYVDGRPQLISSGLGATDYTGGSEAISLFLRPQYIGLEAVSRDGTDVYFSTFETLVPEDHNGEFVKFYDARANGGFPVDPELAPCAAADECHGPDSSPPVAPTVNSSTNLGNGGNLVQEKAKKKKAKKKKAKKKKRKKHRKARKGAKRKAGKSNG
jgi:hypothetical protein